MQAIYHEILPPSGVEFATCLKLTPSTVAQNAPSGSQTNKRALFNIVVARSNLLRVFEVCEEPVPISTQKDDERERRASVRKGTEAVEGEVEMDASGEGFVNIGTVKVNVRLNIQSYHCHIIAFVYSCNCNLFLPNCCEFCECERIMLTPFSLVDCTKWGGKPSHHTPDIPGQRTQTPWNSHRHGERTHHQLAGRWVRQAFGIIQRCEGSFVFRVILSWLTETT